MSAITLNRSGHSHCWDGIWGWLWNTSKPAGSWGIVNGARSAQLTSSPLASFGLCAEMSHGVGPRANVWALLRHGINFCQSAFTYRNLGKLLQSLYLFSPLQSEERITLLSQDCSEVLMKWDRWKRFTNATFCRARVACPVEGAPLILGKHCFCNVNPEWPPVVILLKLFNLLFPYL